MLTGIQVSSLKPLLTTENQVADAFTKLHALGCKTVQLQWIDSSVSMLGTFLQASIRTVCTCWLAPRFGITGIAFSCAIGWSAMLIFEIPYYFITCRKRELPR